eukprot:3818467-Rhodomonas_salina.4
MAEVITSKRAPQPIPTLSMFLALPPLSILPLPPIPLNTCALNPYSKGQVAIVLFVCSATGWVLASVKGFCREPTCYCPVAVLTLDP